MPSALPRIPYIRSWSRSWSRSRMCRPGCIRRTPAGCGHRGPSFERSCRRARLVVAETLRGCPGWCQRCWRERGSRGARLVVAETLRSCPGWCQRCWRERGSGQRARGGGAPTRTRERWSSCGGCGEGRTGAVGAHLCVRGHLAGLWLGFSKKKGLGLGAVSAGAWYAGRACPEARKSKGRRRCLLQRSGAIVDVAPANGALGTANPTLQLCSHSSDRELYQPLPHTEPTLASPTAAA